MDKTNEVATCDAFRLELLQNNYNDGYEYGAEKCIFMKPANACLFAVIKTSDIKIRNASY